MNIFFVIFKNVFLLYEFIFNFKKFKIIGRKIVIIIYIKIDFFLENSKGLVMILNEFWLLKFCNLFGG